MEIGEKIKQIRKKTGKSQREFAEDIGCTQAMISACERGSRKPSYDLMAAFDKYSKKNKIKIRLLN
jgi:transcriptional regulator with XRE-family HTH domain